MGIETGDETAEVEPSSEITEGAKTTDVFTLINERTEKLGQSFEDMVLERLTGADAPDEEAVARRRRALNTKITYVCEAAAEKSGHSPAYHAGVPETTFEKWQKDRNFVYWDWPLDDIDEAIEERMAMDGYKPERPRDTDWLSDIADAGDLGYELYKVAARAHGVAIPDPG